MNNLIDLQIGNSLDKVILKPVSRMDLIKYSGASGDFNPIHTIDEEAIEAGLPGIIAHGMWTMGNLSKLFTPYYEDGFIQVFQVRFLEMVFLNDILTLEATLLEKKSNTLEFQVKVTKEKEIGVLKGNIEFTLYS